MPSSQRKIAFSLIELSVVLIIIGLLTTGVLAGSKLIKSTKKQSILKEIEKFKTAVNSFFITYSALPGDFSEAANFWGGTTNGNGNGQIVPAEASKIMEHLINAELVGGDTTSHNYKINKDLGITILYNTCDGTGSCVTSILENRYYIDLYNKNTTSSTSSYFVGLTSGGGYISRVAITPEESYYIDRKLDDGNAEKGQVMYFTETAWPTLGTDCRNTSTEKYILTETEKKCSVTLRDDLINR